MRIVGAKIVNFHLQVFQLQIRQKIIQSPRRHSQNPTADLVPRIQAPIPVLPKNMSDYVGIEIVQDLLNYTSVLCYCRMYTHIDIV